ncbi:ornithine cyclodeaminase family protein [Emergencia sp.]|uniref:ornithine cyclodeaminase family protein n=1 Tax=Emergencia sp. TaxID=1926557 RepID=UPI003AF19CCF
MILLTANDIDQVYSMRDAIEANKTAFSLMTEGKVVTPLRSNIAVPAYDAFFQLMPSYCEEINMSAVKLVNTFPQNLKAGLPSIPAQVMLMDGKNGQFLALMDGTYVTRVRTGAASGAAFDLLAKKDVSKGALIGTGGQGEKQLEAMITARRLDCVYIYSNDAEGKEIFVEEMKKKLARYDVEFISADSSDEAIEDADLITTVTTARQPVFNADKVKDGATISCIGSFRYEMQEIDPRIFSRTSKIFFDSQEAVLSESGDFIKPLEQGIITKEDLGGDIGRVINGTAAGRERDDEIIIFKSVGVGAMDLMAAKSIYDGALEKNIGTIWG